MKNRDIQELLKNEFWKKDYIDSTDDTYLYEYANYFISELISTIWDNPENDLQSLYNIFGEEINMALKHNTYSSLSDIHTLYEYVLQDIYQLEFQNNYNGTRDIIIEIIKEMALNTLNLKLEKIGVKVFNLESFKDMPVDIDNETIRDLYDRMFIYLKRKIRGVENEEENEDKQE